MFRSRVANSNISDPLPIKLTGVAKIGVTTSFQRILSNSRRFNADLATSQEVVRFVELFSRMAWNGQPKRVIVP